MASDTVRIGFIGAGAIVRQRHVPGLQKIGGVELVGVANRSRSSSERAAEELGIRRVYEDWRELTQSDEVDVVWIGTHPNTHREMSVAALEAGKHVFCQARMAPDYAAAKVMWEAARASDRTTMLCPPPHYMRGDRVIRRLLREGVIGEPRTIVLQSFSDLYADPSKPLHWRQQRAVSGYNTLDVGMMLEVMQRWLGYARRVTALEKTVVPTRAGPDGGTGTVERPDSVSAIAELENGALATLLFSGVARVPRDANRFEIYGSEGTIRYLYAGDTILIGTSADAELRHVPIPPEEAREWTVEADFVAAVRSGHSSAEPSFWDGLKYIEMTEALARSAETGRAVDLPFEPVGAGNR